MLKYILSPIETVTVIVHVNNYILFLQLLGIIISEKEVCGMDRKTESMAKEIWLSYFNRVLYEKGIISEDTKNKMKLKIYQKCRTQSGTK